MPRVSTLRPVTALIATRRTPAGLEVALVHHPAGQRVDGDVWAFPPGDGAPTDAGWRAPPFSPVRDDGGFVLAADAPPGAEWVLALDVLDRWTNDDALVAPWTRAALAALVDGRPLEDACPAGREVEVVDLVPGLRVVPVRTPTLPPATHTNCFVVGDGPEVVVIDPASPFEDEQDRLDRLVDGLGRRVREVLLTHHHPDHVGGAERLARRLGVPIAAHARTAERLLGRGTSVDRLVEDGEAIDLPGPRPRRLRAHLLEGHADGHLVFHEEVTGHVIAGDMVAGTGTIIVDPPEGKMALYLESLHRLKGLGAPVLYPAHGPPIGDPGGLVDEYVAHRLARERKVLAAVEAGAAPVEVLVPRAYPEVAPALYPFAARSLLAHLLKLEAEGRVARAGEAWGVRTTP